MSNRMKPYKLIERSTGTIFTRYIGRLPLLECPHCGVVEDKPFKSDRPEFPKEGELIFHAGNRHCRQWSTVVADGVRKSTPEEIAAWKARKK